MKQRGRLLFWVVLALVGCASAGLLRIATIKGMGLGNDSVAYIGGAQSMLAGDGYSRVWLADHAPITHFPPAMSLILALGGRLGVGVEATAYWMNIGLYGMNAILVGYLAYRFSEKRVVGILASLLFAASHNLLRVHSFVMSEPLYLFLSLVFFLLLEKAFGTGNLRWVLAIGVVTGFAFLTRYVGLALAVTFGIGVLVSRFDRRKILLRAGIFSAGAGVIAGAWLLRNQLVAGSATNRQFIWHPITLEKIQLGMENMWALFLPTRFVEWMQPVWGIAALAWAAVGVWGLIWLVRVGVNLYSNQSNQPQKMGLWLGWMFGMYTLVYLAVMLVSMSVYDAATIFEHRILAPVYLTILVAVAVLAGWVWLNRGKTWKWVVAASLAVLLALSGINQVRKVEAMRHDAQGFASRVWKDSNIIAAIQELPAAKVIYTNKPTLVYILTGRVPEMLPTPYDTALGLDRDTYQADLATLRERADGERAAIVVLGWEWMDTPQGVDWHRQVIVGLTAVTNSSEGTMYLAHP